VRFSWLGFCIENSISYITEGKHSAKGNIHIKCPWCGNDDKSEHMGLSLDEHQPFYACWRNAAHRGRNPARLVATLLDCTWAEALEIIDREDTSSLDQYEAAIARVLSSSFTSEPVSEERVLKMPETFRALAKPGPQRDKFLDYLEGRGFDEVERMAAYYNLRYCRTGSFAQRIIIPIYYEEKVVSWVGRAIGKTERRYINLSEDPETAKRQGFDCPAIYGMGSVLFNYDRAMQGGRTLVIDEGPFDALKVDWFCDKRDTAVAVFGMPKSAQMTLLTRVARKFKRVRVLLDAAAFSNSMHLLDQLQAMLSNVSWLDLPKGVKDPGALPGSEVATFINS
jgi:hypothetical protein